MNRRAINLVLLAALAVAGLGGRATAQDAKPDIRIDAATRQSVIDAVLDTLDKR